MDADIARNLGVALGMAVFSYIVYKSVDRRGKESPPGEPGASTDSDRGLKRGAAVGAIAGTAVAIGFYIAANPQPPGYDEFCAAPLRNVAEIEQAQVDGYEIDRSRKCISKNGYEEIRRRKALEGK